MARLHPVMVACLLIPAVARGAPPSERLTPVVRAYRKAGPAVGNISTTRIVRARLGLFGGNLFDDIFPSPITRRVPVKSLGSGFIVHPAGYLVTNAHVVQRAEKITVTLADKSKYSAAVISADSGNDLAVLKIEAKKTDRLTHLPLGRSDDLMVGETVIAVGNPLGYANTVTTGVISAVDRTLSFSGGLRYTGLIQTDAPINPGNSGGPLLNIAGELIGVNTAVRADAQNIGFAIPVESLHKEFARLVDFERINRVIFGAAVAYRHSGDDAGLHVSAVLGKTPAHGKLNVGDRVVQLNGKPVSQMPEYSCAMLAAKAGSKVQITVLRGGKKVAVTVTLQAKPRPDGLALAQRLFGMTLRRITPDLAKQLRLPMDWGLLVVGIEAGSPADKLGLKLKDILFQVDRLYVKDADGLGIIIEDLQGGRSVKIGIVRGLIRVWAPIRARKGKGPGGSTAGGPKSGK